MRRAEGQMAMGFAGLWASVAFVDVCCRRCMGFGRCMETYLPQKGVSVFYG